jgi:leucyl-tRNA synthetase
MTEELWSELGGKFSIHNSSWPKYDKRLIEEETVTVVIEINGKVRDKMSIKYQVASIKQDVEKLTKESEKIKKYLAGKRIKKVIFVPGRLINFVVK